MLSDAHLLEETGCFALVLEKIPASLAERVARELTIPVIGIGAGGAVDGQVLVVSDMLGMTNGFSPRFLQMCIRDSNSAMILLAAATFFRTPTPVEELQLPVRSWHY